MLYDMVIAFSTYYIPILSEYIVPFSIYHNQSQLLIPTFTTVTAAMYMSRILALNGYYGWTSRQPPDKALMSKVYYHVADHIVCTRVAMNTSWPRYVVLAIQPVLIIAAYVSARLFHKTTVDGGFGNVAILTGVRKETLRLLWALRSVGGSPRP